ncbi:MAG: radical SAM protein [candidate division FCPU426 bacterium]
MKILLVSPINRSYVVMPSLGLGYIASACRSQGHQVSLLHCLQANMTFEGFEAYLRQHAFDVIALQMFSFDLSPVARHLEIAKRVQPRAVTAVGGYHPSGDPQGTLAALPQADFGLAGEAELGFPAFLAALDSSHPAFASVPNLIWRDGSAIRVNPVQVVEKLDEIPFPAWDLMDPRSYPEAPHGAFFKSFPTAPIICTRGCPFSCTFCAGKSVTTRRIRARSVDNILAEMRLLMSEYDVHDFLIEDENFTAHRNLVRSFCERVVEENLRIHWSCPSGVRLDTLDADLLRLMERSGCYSLSVGVEFGTQRIHDLTRKKLSLGLIRDKLKLLRDTSIKITGFFLFGIPGETKADMLETIRFARSLDIDRAQFNNFMPLPGSEIYEDLRRVGKEPRDFDHFFVHDVSFVPDGMTRREMKNLQRRAYLAFYLRPKILWRLAREITSPSHLYRLGRRFADALR